MSPLIILIGLVIFAVIAFIIYRKSAEAQVDVKDINVQTQGIDNAVPQTNQKEVDLNILSGQIGIDSIRTVFDNANNAVKSILSNDNLMGEDALRALDTQMNTVRTQYIDDGSKTRAVNSQPNDATAQNKSSFTTPSTAQLINTVSGGKLPAALGKQSEIQKIVKGERVPYTRPDGRIILVKPQDLAKIKNRIETNAARSSTTKTKTSFQGFGGL